MGSERSAAAVWGDADLARRAADLAGRLPEALAPLARIAYNYRWAWYPRGKEVFSDIDPGRWQLSGENPVRLLQEASSEALTRAAHDPGLLARVVALEGAFAEDLGRPWRL
jgi:starch phosphorylase